MQLLGTLLLLVPLFIGCSELSSIFETPKSRDGGAEEAGSTVTTSEEEGVTSGLIRASEETQTMSSDQGTVIFPPNSLNFDATVTMSKGSDAADASTLSELGLGGSILGGGDPVVIDADMGVNPSAPMTIQLPLPDAPAAALTADPYANLVVVYTMEDKVSGKFTRGVLPRAFLSLLQDSKLIEFIFDRFGSFQAIFLSDPPVEKKEADAAKPDWANDPVNTVNAEDGSSSGGGVTSNPPTSAGDLTVSNQTLHGFRVSWISATDDETAEQDLLYMVFLSSSDNIGTVNDALANGTAQNAFQSGINHLDINGLNPESTYYVNVMVKDEGQNYAIYSSAAATTIADTVGPTPGNSGTMTISNLTSVGLTVNWAPAADNLSLPENLQYTLYRSSSNNIASVADAKANGLEIGSYTANVTSRVVTGLSYSTAYWFTVLAKDEKNLESAYTTLSATTNADDVSPVPGGVITFSNVNEIDFDANWPKADDGIGSAQNTLQYQVYLSATNNIGSVADAQANGTAIGTWTTDIATKAINTGLSPDTSYWINVLVKDGLNNISAYTQANVTTADDPTPPTAGGGGTLSVSDVGTYQLGLSWTKGTDNVGAANQLVYRVCYSTSPLTNAGEITANCTESTSGFVTDIGSWVITGLDADTSYNFNVVIKDLKGNETLYTQKTQKTQKIHLTYFREEGVNNHVSYANKSNGSWDTPTDLATAASLINFGVALDSNDRPHVTYRDVNVYYRKYNGASWDAAETVASGYSNGGQTDIAIDSGDVAHIHHETNDNDLEYRTTAGSWTVSHSQNGTYGNSQHMLFRPNGDPIPTADINGQLRVFYDNTPWTYEVAYSGSVIFFSKGSNDGSNNPHYMLQDRYQSSPAKYKVMYVTGDIGGWTVKEVADYDTDNVGNGGDIFAEDNGEVHIVYPDATNGTIIYAHGSGSPISFTDEVIATVGTSVIGNDCASITVDGARTVHVTYHDGDDSAFRYIQKPLGGNWSSPETIESGDAFDGDQSEIIISD